MPVFRLVVGLILLGLMGYGNFVTLRQLRQGQLLDRQGVTTQATITATRVGRGSRGIAENYYVDYQLPARLDPQGKTHSAAVNYDTFQQAKENGVLPLQYLPSQPSVQRLASVASDWSPLFWMVLLDLIVLGLVALVMKGA